MATSEKRTLEIRAKLVDLLSKPLGGMDGAVVKWARRTVGSIKNVVGSVFNLKSAFVGLAASVLSLSTVKAFGEQANELLKLASATGDTVENLSELSAAFELTTLKGDGLQGTLRALLTKAREAGEGNVEVADSFAAIGVSIDDLRTLGPSQLLEKIAAGLEKFSTAQERAGALGKVLPKQFLDLMPLLGEGLAKFQGIVEDVRRSGATVTLRQAKISDALDDSLGKVKISLGAVSRALIEKFGPDAVALFDKLAQVVNENKGAITEVVAAIGTGLVTGVNLAIEAVIGLVAAIDKIPGVELVDNTELDKQLAELAKKRTQLEQQFGQTFPGGAAAQFKDAFLEAVRDVDVEINRLVVERGQTLADRMRAERDKLRKELADIAAQVGGKSGFSTRTSFGSDEHGNFTATGIAGHSVFGTPETKPLGGLDTDEGAAGDKLAENRLQKQVDALQKLTALAPNVAALRDRLADFQEQAGRDELSEGLKAGLITLDQFNAAMADLADKTARLKQEFGTGDFWQGFSQGAREGIAAFGDLTRAGQEASRVLVDGGLNGVIDGLVDVWSKVKSVEDAFGQLTRSVLTDLAKIILRLGIVKALQAVGFSLADGGVVQGQMGKPVPLKSYASGGVATGPTLALFGEGKQNEAFVPLPDGKRIPVVMSGQGGGGNITINITAMDGKDVKRVLIEQRDTLGAIWRNAVETNRSGSRNLIRGTARG